MTASLKPPVRSRFDDIEPTPAGHFRVHLYGAVLAVLADASERFGSFEAAVKRFPFLSGYHGQLAARLLGGPLAGELGPWCQDIPAWEAAAASYLPLRALREAAGLDPLGVCGLLLLGLVEEDPRFSDLFEALQGGNGRRRPHFGLFQRCWASGSDAASPGDWLHRWKSLGFIQVANPEDPRSDWILQIPSPLWDGLGGGTTGACPGFDHRGHAALRSFDQLILPDVLQRDARALVEPLRSGDVRLVTVRGPAHNGRRTLVGAIARGLERGVVELRSDAVPDADRWRRLAALSLVLNALPVVLSEPGPGESLTTPDFWPPTVPLAIVLGEHGGVSGPLADRAITLTLEVPDPGTRPLHWSDCLSPTEQSLTPEFSSLLRVGSGTVRRLAGLSRTLARLRGRSVMETSDVVDAARSLNREALDSLARPLMPGGDLDQLHTPQATWEDLAHLEQRCRHRERLSVHLGGAPGGRPGCGVRALLTGPSGTGKTLAARLLAGRLRKDLYRLDLSAVVNKYIGETEKNLNRVLDRAEALDVILLLDEGDALLTRRTDVQSSNDRYANLETNFLLQRLEGYQGILLITTNARERIDPAFERRMDVIVEFHPPDTAERRALWQAHLPPENSVGEPLLREISARCQLTGGQIRNVVLHATLLALDNGGVVTADYLEAAVRREYSKTGAVCPLRG